jgi:phage baseplate assembly protein W
MSRFPEIASRIDSAQLTSIKEKFTLRDLANSENLQTPEPLAIFDAFSKPSDLTQSTLQGLKYPLELDGQGGLKLSSGYDRIGEQILEVLETRFGERIYRPFFGTPEVIFESIDEYVLAQTIRSQLLGFLPAVPNIDVKVALSEDGNAQVIVFYSVEGSENSMVKYSFSV